MSVRQRINELIGVNNGDGVGTAMLIDGRWYCETWPWPSVEVACVATRREAEAWLRDVAGATRLIACPALN